MCAPRSFNSKGIGFLRVHCQQLSSPTPSPATVPAIKASPTGPNLELQMTAASGVRNGCRGSCTLYASLRTLHVLVPTAIGTALSAGLECSPQHLMHQPMKSCCKRAQDASSGFSVCMATSKAQRYTTQIHRPIAWRQTPEQHSASSQ